MNELIIFNFNNNQVRTQTLNNEPYFCLRDVCSALGLKNSKDREFNNGVESFYLIDSMGREQQATFINEPNLYRLIFRSNKPQAQAFADWVYNEVLPSVRKTGSYGVPVLTEDKAVMKAIGGLVKKCAAVAVREEINQLFEFNKQNDWEVTDSDLMYQLYHWRATKNRNDTIELRKLHAENDLLKQKLEEVKKLLG